MSNMQGFGGLEKARDSDPVYNLLLSQGGVLGKADRQWVVSDMHFSARWAPTSYKYKWPYKWITRVITLLIGVTIPFITGRCPSSG